MITTTGIDVGSAAIKVAVCRSAGRVPGGEQGDSDSELLATAQGRIRRRDPGQVLTDCYARALAEAGLAEDAIDYVATTGEGDVVEVRRGHFYSMTAHARGAIFLVPETRAVLDIGALHGRAIKLDERSKVLGYRMTSQCASGSGQFLENISRYLGVTVEEIGPLSLNSASPEKVSGICAVLAETDVINMVARGITVPDILRGIHSSMANRYVRLLASARAQGSVLVTGGLSLDVGLFAAMEQEVERQKVAVELHTDDRSVYAGAIGAALWGAFRHARLSERGAA
jgi:benzoyl-CoA reductase subunit D